MRFDEGSARFAEFGPFCTGMVGAGRGRARQVRARCGSVAGAADARAASRRSSALRRRARRASAAVVVAFSGGADSAFLAWVATDDARCRPGPLRHRRVAVAGARGAGRLPGPGRRVGTALARGRRPTSWPTRPTSANDGDRCYHCKAEPAWTLSRPLAAAEAAAGRARRQPRRPRRPPARPAGRGRARAPSSRWSTAGFTKADVRAASPRASACAPGTSRRPPAWRRASPTARR